MNRRAFLGTVAGGLVVVRSIVEAQQAAKVYRIGFLTVASAESSAQLLNALTAGLRDLSYVCLLYTSDAADE